MNAPTFRRLALALPEARESAHMRHPDFRVGGKIFATLGYPDAGFGMVKLTPAQQARVLGDAPDVFRPAAGAWGRSGSTIVRLASARVATLRPIMRQAWENVSGGNLVRPSAASSGARQRRR